MDEKQSRYVLSSGSLSGKRLWCLDFKLQTLVYTETSRLHSNGNVFVVFVMSTVIGTVQIWLISILNVVILTFFN